MSKRKNKRANRQKLVFLTIAIIAALIVGLWLLIVPGLEKQKALAEQNRLLDSIEQGGGVITLDARFVSGEVDFYDGPDEASPMENAELTMQNEDAAQNEAPSDSAPEPDNSQFTTLNSPLNIEGIGILTIDKINLKLPVVDSVSKAQLKIAVGRVPETAEIGATGNAVIAGHRSYTYGDYFNRLGEMEIGDVIVYTPIGGGAMRFEVYDVLTVDPGDQRAFYQPGDYSEITLLTCTPIRTATHRLLVRAKLIEGR